MIKIIICLFTIVYCQRLVNIVDNKLVLTTHFADTNNKYVVVAIIGQARVGKSTLINHIVGDKVATVSSSQKSCTRGIYYYKRAIDNYNLLLLDLEGDDMGNVIQLSTYAASVAEIVIYYSRDKFNMYSANSLKIFKKYGTARTYISLVRGDLDHEPQAQFDLSLIHI